MDISNAKLKGKAAVRGNAVAFWAISVLISLPVSILSGMGTSISNMGNLNKISGAGDLATMFGAITAVGAVISAVFSILAVVASIFVMPLTAGLAAKYLHVLRGGDRREVSALVYYQNKDWAEKIKAYLLVAVYVAIGTILCVIPGIVLAIRYSMLGFVFADNPGINYSEAMHKTRELTKGRGGQIFLFYLSFIGWYLLLIVTCGLSSIYSEPYQTFSFAALYDTYAERDGVLPTSGGSDSGDDDGAAGDTRDDEYALPKDLFTYDGDDKIRF